MGRKFLNCQFNIKEDMEKATLPRKTLNNVLNDFADQGVLVKIRGNCMAPLLKEGDAVAVRRMNKYKSGDILAVRLTDGQLVSHRLLGAYIWKGRRHFMTSPDNSHIPDHAVISERIMGKIMTTGAGHPLPVVPPLCRFRLFGDFFYFLCRRLFAKIR